MQNLEFKIKKTKIEVMKYILIFHLLRKDIKKMVLSIEINYLIYYSIYLVPFFFYLQVGIDHQALQQPFFYDHLPGITTLANNIAPQTVQKTSYFPSKLSIFLKKVKKSNVLDSEQIRFCFFEQNIQKIEDFSRYLTIHFFDLWKSYKKQYFFGIKKRKKVLIFASRIQNENDAFATLDEFPFKVQNMYKNNNHFKVLDINEPNLDLIENEQMTNKKDIQFKKSDPKQNCLVCIKDIDLVNDLQDSKKLYEQKAYNVFKPMSKQLRKRLGFDRKKQNTQRCFFRFFSQNESFVPIKNMRKKIRFKKHVLKSLLLALDQQQVFCSKTKRSMSNFVYPDTTSKRLLEIYYHNKNYDSFLGFFWKRSFQFKMGSYSQFAQIPLDFPKDSELKKFGAKKIQPFNIAGEIHYKGYGLMSIPLNNLSDFANNLRQKLENPCTNQIVSFRGKIWNPQVVNFKPMARIRDRFSKFQNPIKIAKLTNSYSQFKKTDRKQKTRLRISGKNFKSRIFIHTHPEYSRCYVTPVLTNLNFNRWLYYWFGLKSLNLKEVKLAKPVKDLRYKRIRRKRRKRPIPKRKMRIFPQKYLYTLTNDLDYQKNVGFKTTDLTIFHKQQSPFRLPNEGNVGFFVFGRMHFKSVETTKRKRSVSEPMHNKWWLFFVQFLVFLGLFDLGNQMLDTYGRELVDYLIDFFASLGILNDFFKEEYDLTSETDAQYKIIEKSKIRFQHIIGLNAVFYELTEFICFLRQKGQTPVSDVIPRGLLFVGPPGTGKTLLVKALAGESEAPLIIQASSSLVNMDGYGSQRLEKLFTRARTYPRCILFFDEIDSIGKGRSNICQNALGGDRLIQMLGSQKNIPTPNSEVDEQQELDTNQLSILTQLLIELDGVKEARSIVVIGATNRLKVLDKALIRPGRFNRIFKVGLPNKPTRIEMCQFYGEALGFDLEPNWDYIGRRTIGFSGADICTIMNQSTMLGVVQNTKHTIETIDVAINRVICKQSDFTETQNTQKKHVWVLAYYQTGLAITPFLLDMEKMQPNICTLFPLRYNARYQKTINKIWNEQLNGSTRSEMESLLISLYSGKISEYLFGHSECFLSLTSLGKEELQKASDLIYRLIDKWILYSVNSIQDPFVVHFAQNFNNQEFYNDREMFEYFAQLNKKQNLDPLPEFRYEEFFLSFRHWETRGWWQFQIMEEHNASSEGLLNWSRFYLNAPEETLLNQEWLPPEQYFHSNEMFFLTKSIHLHDLYSIKRDILYQTIVSNCIQTTFDLIASARILLDLFAFHLYHRSVLRDNQIKLIYKQIYR